MLNSFFKLSLHFVFLAMKSKVQKDSAKDIERAGACNKLKSSRIRLTCLPKNIDEETLRSKLKPYGCITDLVLLKTSLGDPRMGFIGFKTCEEANRCISEMNGAYIGNRRIIVELAKPVINEAHRSASLTKRCTQRYQNIKSSGRENAIATDRDFFERIHAPSKITNLVKQDEQGTQNWRIILKNLPYESTFESLQEYISQNLGDFLSVHMPKTINHGRSRGIAFVSFRQKDEALNALRFFQNHEFQGRLLVADTATPNPYDSTSSERVGSTRNLKKYTKYRENAGNSNSMLYMDHNTVHRIAEDHLSAIKENTLDRSNPGAAARSALMEAVLTNDLRASANECGVNMSALQGKPSVAKSQRILVVKNLPETTQKIQKEVEQLFGQYGKIECVRAPQKYGILIVAFAQSDDALRAFRRLSFSAFQGAPLFLEWADAKIFNDSFAQHLNKIDSRTNENCKRLVTDRRTLYIQNIPFNCSEEKLIQSLHLQVKCRGIEDFEVSSARIISAKGYAFVEFFSKVHSSVLLPSINTGYTIDDRVVRAEERHEASLPEAQQSMPVPAGCDPKKITVKNVPFEANISELRSLFSAFSDVESIRMPKKTHHYSATSKNNHRGFAFVEFATHEGAARAIAALMNTHIYGRHLVLEYSKQG